MRSTRRRVIAVSVAATICCTSVAFSQASRATLTFEVVSIRRNVSAEAPVGPPPGSRVDQRPNGITMINVPVSTLIARAYPPAIPREIVGLPEWVRRERYDVIATSSSSSVTSDERLAMMRSMLADRFKLAVHVEKREQPAFDLVLARGDGKLGSGLMPVDVRCPANRAASDASPDTPPFPPQLPDFKSAPPPCTLRTVGALMRDRLGDGQGKLGDLL
jgi:hypothetical protein